MFVFVHVLVVAAASIRGNSDETYDLSSFDNDSATGPADPAHFDLNAAMLEALESLIDEETETNISTPKRPRIEYSEFDSDQSYQAQEPADEETEEEWQLVTGFSLFKRHPLMRVPKPRQPLSEPSSAPIQ